MSRTFRRKNYPHWNPSIKEEQEYIDSFGSARRRSYSGLTAKQAYFKRYYRLHGDKKRNFKAPTYINGCIRADFKNKLVRALHRDLEDAYIAPGRNKRSICWLID